MSISPRTRSTSRPLSCRRAFAPSCPCRCYGRAIRSARSSSRREEGRPFSDTQIALLETFADQAVIAIENVRLFTELQDRNRALTAAHAQVSEALEQQTATAEILRVISRSQTDVQPVFDAIARSASRLCKGMYAIVTRFDGDLLHLVAQHNPRPGTAERTTGTFPRRPGRDSPSGRALFEGNVVHIPDVEKDPNLSPEVVRAAGARSFLAVPMLREGRPIGTIGVSRAEVGSFPPEQIELVETFADQAVIAIENVRLFTELEARNRELTEALEQQTATRRDPAGHLQLADRRPAGLRGDRRERRAVVRSSEWQRRSLRWDA